MLDCSCGIKKTRIMANWYKVELINTSVLYRDSHKAKKNGTESRSVPKTKEQYGFKHLDETYYTNNPYAVLRKMVQQSLIYTYERLRKLNRKIDAHDSSIEMGETPSSNPNGIYVNGNMNINDYQQIYKEIVLSIEKHKMDLESPLPTIEANVGDVIHYTPCGFTIPSVRIVEKKTISSSSNSPPQDVRGALDGEDMDMDMD